MFKKRFLLGLVTGSILLASLTVSSFSILPSSVSSGRIGSFHQQHQDRAVAAQDYPPYHLDCFRRTYNFGQKQSSNSALKDASNYFLNVS